MTFEILGSNPSPATSYRNLPRPKARRSAIWLTPKEDLVKIVSSAESFVGILRSIGVYTVGANINTLKRRIKFDSIDCSHIPSTNKGRKFRSNNRLNLQDILVSNSNTARNVVRRRLISQAVIPYECKECGMKPEWNGKKLSLVLDHENGIPNDHRIENLRFLCPNCNSQTPTFSGRKRINY